MSNILNHIEEKLYRANYKTEDNRQQAYLSIHAAISKNKEVPRVYIPQGQVSVETFETILAHLLLSDTNKIVEITNKYISGLNISTKQINSLSFEDKEELLSLIDDLLLNGWGKGHIFYEKMRLSPKSDCNLLKWIKTQNVSNDDKYISLIRKLELRLKQGIDNTENLNKVFSNGERRYNPTILSKSYELILEKIWRVNWNQNTNYMVMLDEEELLSKLIFIEEI
jgi:hypothetical protein